MQIEVSNIIWKSYKYKIIKKLPYLRIQKICNASDLNILGERNHDRAKSIKTFPYALS